MLKQITRRTMLATAGAMAVMCPPRLEAEAAPITLRAGPGQVALVPDPAIRTPVWHYGGSVPGPVLRAMQGSRLSVSFDNALPQPSSVHWHGIRIDNAMDGVVGLTQNAVTPGSRFAYDVMLPDAGTFWYHPHNRTWEQMARGLYGALIVDEPDPPEVDHDLVWMIDDWRLTRDGTIDESFGQMRDWSHAGRIGNWVTVNGKPEQRSAVRRHDRLRLRLVNTANARIFSLSLQGLAGWVVALDGQPLEAPIKAGRLALAPAQRIDLIVDVTAEVGEEAFLISHERDGGYAVAVLAVGAGTARPRPAPVALPPNPLTAPDLGDAKPAALSMQGGAMGQMSGARLEGQERSIRELVGAGKAWAFNGHADLTKEPLIRVARDQSVRLRMTNDTAWPHAMHLHGHHFREILGDGTLGPWRDTMLMQRAEARDVVFVADNPGKWLLHCHMLEHAAAGMQTWIEVTV